MSDGNDSLSGPASELPSPVNMDSSSSYSESSSSSESESGPEVWDLSSSESDKIGKNYKLVPCKSYVYYDIQSLQRL